MKILELFAGSRSFSRTAENNIKNVKTYTSDIEPFKDIDQVSDIMNFNIGKAIDYLGGVPNVVWASPPCTYFSVASIGHHWNKDHSPKTEKAVEGVNIVKKTMDIIKELKFINPDLVYFVENPRGKLRKLNLIDPYQLKTVTYCSYGDMRMKPTDIWTNSNWLPRPMCYNGNRSCHHQPAPRGSQTGTQGLKNAYEKSKIPKELCLEILNSLSKN